MPIYEYRCAGCGFAKEYLQKLSDAPITACPSCGQPEMVKLVSAAGFQLKGSGWYATDFKNAGVKPKKDGTGDTKAEKAEKAGDGKAGEKSSDAAPAAAPPAST